jgi:hypothetical protein
VPPSGGANSGVSCWTTPLAVGDEHTCHDSAVITESASSAEATVGQSVGSTPPPPGWTVTSTRPTAVAPKSSATV